MGTNRDHETGLLTSRLEQLEVRFGGVQRNVERRRVSRYDPRGPVSQIRGTMQGGDRMCEHGYSAHYANHLLPRMKCAGLVVVEIGVLRGSGLALLCEIFPKASRVIGLDVDPSHYRGHRKTLEALGAFRKKSPEVHEFDELAPDAALRLAGILAGDKIDVLIHDALHYDKAILGTLSHALSQMRPDGVAFIEDNATVAKPLRERYGDRFAVASYDRLTVLWR